MKSFLTSVLLASALLIGSAPAEAEMFRCVRIVDHMCDTGNSDVYHNRGMSSVKERVGYEHGRRCADGGTPNNKTHECDVHLAGAKGVPQSIEQDPWCKTHPGKTHDVPIDLDGIQAVAHYKCR